MEFKGLLPKRRTLSRAIFKLHMRQWLQNTGLVPYKGWITTRLILLRLLRWLLQLPRLLLGFIIFQIGLMAALFLYAKIRKRGIENPFPQLEIPPLQVSNHELQLFDDGESVFKAMLHDIEQAQHSILLESYIFEDDDVGRMFRNALIKKSREGVTVRVIFDGIGSLHVPEKFKFFGRRKNIRVLEFGRLRTLKSYFDLNMWIRTHRKILVIDHQIAYLGGMNIGRNYEKTWRDTHLKISGAMARTVAHEFIELWNANNKKYPIHFIFPPAKDEHIAIYANNPFENRLPIRHMYLEAINGAQRNIYITNAYFLPDSGLRHALITAAQRGVDVQIIVPFISDNIVVDWITRGIISELICYGVRVLLYKVTMIHAKTMTVDGTWSTVGSANLDARSLGANYEINAVVEDIPFARQMEAMFVNDRAQSSEVQAKYWLNRNLLIRAGEFALQPVRGLF